MTGTRSYDNISYKLILALRIATDVSESALLAHYIKGRGRISHIYDALNKADRVTAAAEALRAEIARIESNKENGV